MRLAMDLERSMSSWKGNFCLLWAGDLGADGFDVGVVNAGAAVLNVWLTKPARTANSRRA